jgi:hypothetical protein
LVAYRRALNIKESIMLKEGGFMSAIDYGLPNARWRRLLYGTLDFYLQGLEEVLKYVDVYKHGKRIFIAAGELFPDFYNNEDVIGNIGSSAKDEAEIKVLFGPALYSESYGFLKLAMEYDNIELFCRQIREDSHFKLIEDIEGRKFAFVDAPHGVDVDKRDSILLTDDYREVIDVLFEEFKSKIKAAEKLEKDNLVKRMSDERRINEHGQLCGFISRSTGKASLATEGEIKELETKLQEN